MVKMLQKFKYQKAPDVNQELSLANTLYDYADYATL
jgi:hypothetical protein